jgi:hypothetical protein
MVKYLRKNNLPRSVVGGRPLAPSADETDHRSVPMPHRNPLHGLTPWLLAAAFVATLSLLTLRDRLDAPTRLVVEPTAGPVLVVPAR